MSSDQLFERYEKFLSYLHGRYVGQSRAKLAVADLLSESGRAKASHPIIVAIGRFGLGKTPILSDTCEFLYDVGIVAYTGEALRQPVPDNFFSQSDSHILFLNPFTCDNGYADWLQAICRQVESLQSRGNLRRAFVMKIELSNPRYQLDDSDLKSQFMRLAKDPANRDEHLPAVLELAFEIADAVLPFETYSEAELRELIRRTLHQDSFRLQAYGQFKGKSHASAHFTEPLVNWLYDSIQLQEGSFGVTVHAVDRAVKALFEEDSIQYYDRLQNPQPFTIDVRDDRPVIIEDDATYDVRPWL